MRNVQSNDFAHGQQQQLTQQQTQNESKQEGKANKRQQVKTACTSCRKLHIACDEKRPCSQCEKRNRGATCTDGAPRMFGKVGKRSSVESWGESGEDSESGADFQFMSQNAMMLFEKNVKMKYSNIANHRHWNESNVHSSSSGNNSNHTTGRSGSNQSDYHTSHSNRNPLSLPLLDGAINLDQYLNNNSTATTPITTTTSLSANLTNSGIDLDLLQQYYNALLQSTTAAINSLQPLGATPTALTPAASPTYPLSFDYASATPTATTTATVTPTTAAVKTEEGLPSLPLTVPVMPNVPTRSYDSNITSAFSFPLSQLTQQQPHQPTRSVTQVSPSLPTFGPAAVPPTATTTLTSTTPAPSLMQRLSAIPSVPPTTTSTTAISAPPLSTISLPPLAFPTSSVSPASIAHHRFTSLQETPFSSHTAPSSHNRSLPPFPPSPEERFNNLLHKTESKTEPIISNTTNHSDHSNNNSEFSTIYSERLLHEQQLRQLKEEYQQKQQQQQQNQQQQK